MSKELKDLTDSIDSANQAHSDLETTIRYLKEEVQRLNFTVSEQKKIIQNQESKISNNNIPEDTVVLKDLITEQSQEIIKKDKDIEILEQTIADISTELENVQNFEGENEELIYANKEIVQLTEENEAYRNHVEDLINAIKELQDGKDKTTVKGGEETSELIDAKKLIIKLPEENSLNQFQIEELKRKEQESEALKIHYSHELNELTKIIDQLTFDNDQYHEKVNYLQQKLGETVRLQEEQFKEIEEETGFEETNQKIFDLKVENNELKKIINTNIAIIENLKQRNQDRENEMEEKAKIEDQKLDDLRQKASEKDEELNKLNLKLQKIETANTQLSDLIVELKALEDTIEHRVEHVTIPKQTVFENYPPTLFFKMYKMLSNDYKTLIVDLLIEDLKSSNRDSRTYAIKILSTIKGPKIFDELKGLVEDDDWIVKLYLIKALGNFDYSETAELLKVLQEDGDPDVREAAIGMLLKLNIQ